MIFVAPIFIAPHQRFWRSHRKCCASLLSLTVRNKWK